MEIQSFTWRSHRDAPACRLSFSIEPCETALPRSISFGTLLSDCDGVDGDLEGLPSLMVDNEGDEIKVDISVRAKCFGTSRPVDVTAELLGGCSQVSPAPLTSLVSKVDTRRGSLSKFGGGQSVSVERPDLCSRDEGSSVPVRNASLNEYSGVLSPSPKGLFESLSWRVVRTAQAFLCQVQPDTLSLNLCVSLPDCSAN